MFSSGRNAYRIPDQTLALTYDDGPGPDTLAIAEFLSERRIPATFFVVGNHVRADPEIVRKVRALGHWIGNHTTTHRPLAKLLDSPSEIVRELSETDDLICEYVGEGPFLFRAPYGSWTEKVAAVLNGNEALRKYVGHIGWDIEEGDCAIGSHRHLRPRYVTPGYPIYSFGQCCMRHLQSIRAKRKGVVLMHDWSADNDENFRDVLRRNNRTLELTQWLVPRLEDFRFVSLDALVANRG